MLLACVWRVYGRRGRCRHKPLPRPDLQGWGELLLACVWPVYGACIAGEAPVKGLVPIKPALRPKTATIGQAPRVDNPGRLCQLPTMRGDTQGQFYLADAAPGTGARSRKQIPVSWPVWLNRAVAP